MVDTILTAPSPRLSFDPELIRKYDGFGPRYTSYPTADRFTEAFTAEHLVNALLGRFARAAAAAAVAVRARAVLQHDLLLLRVQQGHHQGSRALGQVHRLRRQGDRHRVRRWSSAASPVTQLHWGGGTPTFLARRRNDAADGACCATTSRLRRTPRCSIEVDPRKVDADDHRAARRARLQPHERSASRISIPSRAAGGQSHPERGGDARGDRRRARERLPLAQRRPDLRPAAADGRRIRGDARQGDRRGARTASRSTATRTCRTCSSRSGRSRDAELPSPDAKLAILALAIDKLTAAGYVYIGMDHFAQARRRARGGAARRQAAPQFPGLLDARPTATCSRSASRRSARSARPTAQNVKTLDEYYERLDADALPCCAGWSSPPTTCCDAT